MELKNGRGDKSSIINQELTGQYKVYAHVNKINGKIYIGQTKQEFKDRCGHEGNSYKHSAHFMNAIKKYGWDNFHHIILFENLSLDLANLIEEELIKIYNTMDNKKGYNMIAGGNNRIRRPEVTEKIAEKNRHPSKETLKRMSLASLGRKHSSETIEKIRKSNLGKKRSLETRKNMSIAKQNISDETRKKIGDASRGRKLSEEQKQLIGDRSRGNKYRAKEIVQYDLEGIFIKCWTCAKDVENELGIDHGNIGKCCNNNAKTAGGFQWKYYNGSCENIDPVNYNKIPIEQYDINGKLIRRWDYISQIVNETGYFSSNIDKCCKGKIKTAYGYIWKRCDTDDL